MSSKEPVGGRLGAESGRERFFIVAQELEGWGAHYLYYADACSQGWLLATRSPAHVLVGLQCAPAIIDHLLRGGAIVRVVPSLVPLSDLPRPEGSIGGFEPALRDLDASFEFTDRDVIFVPTAGIDELLSSARFLGQRSAGLRPRVALLFHDEEELLTSLQNSGHASQAAAALRGVQRSLTLWSTAPRPSHAPLSNLLQTELLSLPIPIDPRLARPAPGEAGSDQTTLGFLGLSRPTKGVDLLLAGLPALAQYLPDASFILQLARHGRYAQNGGVMLGGARPSLDQLANVRLVEDELRPSSFAALLEEIDILLLPYDPVAYSRRMSGIFALGAAAGKVFVTSRGSSMAAAISEGRAAGALFPWHRSFSERLHGLQSATLAAVSSLAGLRGLAQERSIRWSQWSGRACVERLCQ